MEEDVYGHEKRGPSGELQKRHFEMNPLDKLIKKNCMKR